MVVSLAGTMPADLEGPELADKPADTADSRQEKQGDGCNLGKQHGRLLSVPLMGTVAHGRIVPHKVCHFEIEIRNS